MGSEMCIRDRYIRSWYVYQHFRFDFPFDEIYRRLLFFTLTRYGCATPGTYTNIFFLIFRLMTYTDVCFFHSYQIRMYNTCRCTVNSTAISLFVYSDVSFRVPVISGNKVQRSVPWKFPETFPHFRGVRNAEGRGVMYFCIFFVPPSPAAAADHTSTQQTTLYPDSRQQTADSRQQTATTKTTCLFQHPPLGGLWGPRSRLNLEMSRAAQPCLRW